MRDEGRGRRPCQEPRTENREPKHGFTLVELLIVAALVSVVALAVFGTFASSINLMERLTKESAAEDAAVFFDKISYELRNSFHFAPLSFTGTQRAITFPTIVPCSDKDGAATVGQVSYIFNARQRSLFRQQATVSDVYKDARLPEQRLVEDVIALRFLYYCYDVDRGEYFWATMWEWDEEAFLEQEYVNPQLMAVRIEIVTQEGTSRQTYTKTVSIPAWHFSRKEESS